MIIIATEKRTTKKSEEQELEEAFLQATIPESSGPSVGYQGYNTKKKAAKTAKKSKPKKTSNPSGGGLNSKKKIILIACCAALLVLLAAGGAFAYFMHITTDNGLVFANVYIGGINLGGKTPEEAEILLNQELVPQYTQDMVIVLPDGEQCIPQEDVNVFIDVSAIVEDAYNYGRQGNRYEQYKARSAAALTSYQLDLLDYMSLNSAAIRDILDEIDPQYNVETVEASADVIGERPSLESAEEEPQVLVLTAGRQGVFLDTDALYSGILEAYKQGIFQLEPEVVYTDPGTIDLQAIYDEYYTAPMDASYALVDGSCVVLPDNYGYQFDLEAAQAQLDSALPGEVIEIPMTYIEPEVYAQTLEKLLFRDTLATCNTTLPGSSDNRNINLALASQSLNGTIVMPGEVFSYNEDLGQRTAAKGYKPSPTYSSTGTVESIGGGICQGASALYYCTLMADLEIVERKNHSLNVSYVPLGMDATVSWGSIDFKFRNNTDYPIMIGSSAEGCSINVWLVGTDVKDYYVKMEYELISETPAPIQYSVMAYNNPNGYTDGQILQYGHTGYKVETYKCKYSKSTNQLISRAYEASSTYKTETRILVKIDPSTIPTEPTPPPETTEPTPPPETTEPIVTEPEPPAPETPAPEPTGESPTP